MTAEVTVTFSGALFSGHADSIVDAFLDDATYQVAAQGLSNVHDILNREIKDPTPYYETQVRVDAAHQGYVVHDQVVYGPWLEGVTSRNAATRYKGMHHYRRAGQQLERQAPVLAERLLPKYLGRLS
jgi:hypothetical protein